MEIIKNVYYPVTIEGEPLEIAVRSDFNEDYSALSYCIVQIRIIKPTLTLTRYATMSPKQLKQVFGLSSRTRLTIKRSGYDRRKIKDKENL